MIVWVVMGNDFPNAVFASEAAAETYIAAKKAERTERDRAGWPSIHWRSYNFEVRQ